MKSTTFYKILFLTAAMLFFACVHAQNPNLLRGLSGRMSGLGSSSGGGKDSLRRRPKNEDSITIRIYYLDSSRGSQFDSSILNLSNRFPVSPYDLYLGNLGYATKPLLFTPKLTDGWDYGMHAYDAYHFSLDKARFFNTTRPYTELGYTLGSQSQQILEVLHTQNIKPNWNAAFHYRLIGSPGFFKNEQAGHTNVSFTSWYQSKNKRYNNYAILLYNKSIVNENGGIINDSTLDNPIYDRRFAIPVNMGNDVIYSPNIFSSTLMVGNRYTQTQFLLRQQYDFGRKDSLVTDSTVIPLFYPRLRFENTTSFSRHQYLFQDMPASNNTSSHNPFNGGDTVFLGTAYNIPMRVDTLSFQDSWKEFNTDFSVYAFPDARNLQQFLKAGLSFQQLNGTHQQYVNSDTQWSSSYYNVFLHGEYRNRSRNQKWDILANGSLYLTGYNAGDYRGYISLQRLLSSRFGSLQLGFENANSTPPFLFNTHSSFYLDINKTFLKQNTTHLFASIVEPRLKLQLNADYFLISNYFYLTNYYQLNQESSLFNVLRIGARKALKLYRHWNLYSELYIQQKTGNVQVNFPSLFTRHRLAYEGQFFRNLNLSTGVELRYNTPYAADGYSPILGQFFYQNSITIANRPEVDAFLNFRIRTFKAYVRVENLNTVSLRNGFGFTNNNLAAPGYPYPGMVFRFGVYWSFVN